MGRSVGPSSVGKSVDLSVGRRVAWAVGRSVDYGRSVDWFVGPSAGWLVGASVVGRHGRRHLTLLSDVGDADA